MASGHPRARRRVEGGTTEEPEQTDTKVLAKTKPHLKPTDTVLDYGCGKGSVDEVAPEQQLEVRLLAHPIGMPGPYFCLVPTIAPASLSAAAQLFFECIFRRVMWPSCQTAARPSTWPATIPDPLMSYAHR